MIEIDIELLKGIANQLRIHSIAATTAAGSGVTPLLNWVKYFRLPIAIDRPLRPWHRHKGAEPQSD